MVVVASESFHFLPYNSILWIIEYKSENRISEIRT